jgi:2-(1,2-epoxy-1,2-dihydrophenyl)acetyl-CoA isomerase
MIMTSDAVLHEKLDGYARVTLNRPQRLNAFNEDQHLQLRAALAECAADADCRAVIVTGAGRGFCAGQDLSDRDPTLDGPRPDLGLTLETYYNPLIRQMRSLAKPVVCAVNGVAAGAGANIAFACDLVLAAKSARFIQAFSKIGLIPDSGGTLTLPRLVGRARAYALAALAEPVTAETAESWGMIWKAVDDGALAGEAEALAVRLAAMPTGVLVRLREGLDLAETGTLSAQLDWERDAQAALGRSDDYQEGVAAFMEKRPARFAERS